MWLWAVVSLLLNISMSHCFLPSRPYRCWWDSPRCRVELQNVICTRMTCERPHASALYYSILLLIVSIQFINIWWRYNFHRQFTDSAGLSRIKKIKKTKIMFVSFPSKITGHLYSILIFLTRTSGEKRNVAWKRLWFFPPASCHSCECRPVGRGRKRYLPHKCRK